MALHPKPAEGSWTEHYPHVGTGVVSYEDCISPEFYEVEREAVFKRAWLNVGRVEDVPRNGSYFTKELEVANTSIVVVRGLDGEVRAFHNICRHRGNKLVWTDYPRQETSGSCRAFACKYHGWRYALDGACTFVRQECEFFDFDRSNYGLVPVHCDVWAGFIFVNLAKDPAQSLPEFLGPMITALDAMPDDARHLLQLVHSIIMVSMCVDIWHQPNVVDGGDAELHRIAEPSP
jgi:glycine betaine catabolism A